MFRTLLAVVVSLALVSPAEAQTTHPRPVTMDMYRVCLNEAASIRHQSVKYPGRDAAWAKRVQACEKYRMDMYRACLNEAASIRRQSVKYPGRDAAWVKRVQACEKYRGNPKT